ncbi:MAG: hypothetical protein RLZZ11_1442, partial [Cyanobacteriota bacterium]
LETQRSVGPIKNSPEGLCEEASGPTKLDEARSAMGIDT